MLLEEVEKLISNDPLPLEMGYYRLPNGQIHIAIVTRMPGCKAHWVNLYYWHLADEIEEGLSEPPYEKKFAKVIQSNRLDMKFYGRYMAGSKVEKVVLRLVQPETYFDLAKVKSTDARGIICCNLLLPDQAIDTHVIHVIHDTDYGCEMRSRFWANNCSDEMAKIRFNQLKADMGYIADFLREMVLIFKSSTNKPDVDCKFCHSDNVVKNGTRCGT